MTAAIIAKAGESFVNHFFDNFWIVLGIKVALILGFALSAPMVVGYMEHKVLAHMQHRLGPMYAGRFHGWAQLIADGVKFIQKEDVIPAAADSWVFTLAPAVVLVPYIALFLVIPFGDTLFAENLDVGIFFVLAITAVSVIGVLMAGWASANKFSLIGALRAAAQLIAYELPMILGAVAVVMQAGTLSLVGIAEAQHQYWYVFTQPVMFLVFMIASLAELTRPPFDMPVADSEIIFGAYTEYTGLKFAFFLLAEYTGIVAFSAIASVLFLGGYQALPGLGFLPGFFHMSGKVGALSFFIIWLRATYPRLREDQLQRFSWVVLIPVSLADIMATGAIKVLVK
jgi:NADH-quinone oxidoreductase subunit H